MTLTGKLRHFLLLAILVTVATLPAATRAANADAGLVLEAIQVLDEEYVDQALVERGHPRSRRTGSSVPRSTRPSPPPRGRSRRGSSPTARSSRSLIRSTIPTPDFSPRSSIVNGSPGSASKRASPVWPRGAPGGPTVRPYRPRERYPHRRHDLRAGGLHDPRPGADRGDGHL